MVYIMFISNDCVPRPLQTIFLFDTLDKFDVLLLGFGRGDTGFGELLPGRQLGLALFRGKDPGQQPL